MSNKTNLQENNVKLQNLLTNINNLPTSEDVQHGAYVWRKYTATSDGQPGEFVRYEVDDDYYLYPQAGVSGAYYYEMVGATRSYTPMIEHIPPDNMFNFVIGTHTTGSTNPIKTRTITYTMKADGRVYYSGGCATNTTSTSSSYKIRCVILKNDQVVDARSMRYEADGFSSGGAGYSYRGSMTGLSFAAKKDDVIKIILEVNYSYDAAFLDAWAVYI